MIVQIFFDTRLDFKFLTNRLPLAVRDCVQSQKKLICQRLLAISIGRRTPHVGLKVTCKRGTYLVTCTLDESSDSFPDAGTAYDLSIEEIELLPRSSRKP